MNDNGYLHDPTLSIDRKVAIVGIGCRFPNNISTVEDFWRVISNGEDCMIPHPPERIDPSYLYPEETLPGKIYTLRAGYLNQDVYAFDREFFQISPDEASHMDPQQRLLLEVAFEALENYGVDVGTLRESQTGVFIGVMAKEYIHYLCVPIHKIGPYTGSGNSSNMLSNRISYQFDFQGPSVTIDTACSSSLYSIHYACEAIRNNECSLALAGGVNLLLSTATTAQLCQARMVSKDGFCKSFDQTADGYARGEGAGVLVLKSLRRALADGDKIYAVIRGGALNNDGKTKGITTPNPQSQLNLLKMAYDSTNTSPQDVTYIEAHGTGTQAGDVAESTALGSVIGVGERNHNLVIGSVKSNFGHTEGAAGVAGVIKSALVLEKKQIPQIVHFRSRNENVDWERFQITLPTELMGWPTDSKYLAGCNSFGFGGANAHLVLEAAPNRIRHDDERAADVFPSVLFLSAESKQALKNRVSSWIEYLKSPVENFQNILLTAALRATHHQHRLALYCESKEQTIEALKLRAAERREVTDMCVEGQVQKITNDKNKLAFVFSGMGTQWWAMGRQLMATDQTFQTSILEMDKLLKGFGAAWSLAHILTKETDQEKINDTAIAQPAICAVQISLVRVYRRYGIFPKMVIGHSVGEVAAAHVAGYLTIQDAMRLIYVRGLSLRRTAEKGKMAAILAPANEVRHRLEKHEYVGKIDIACVNSSVQTVISGCGNAVESFVELWKAQGVRCVVLKVQNAFHSFQQEEVKEYFLQRSKFLKPHKFQLSDKYVQQQIPMVSTVNSKLLTAQNLNNNEYWWRNIRQTVEFSKSLHELFVSGCNIFLEIGPHPSLASVIKTEIKSFSDESISFFHESFSVIGSLRRPPDTSQAAPDRRDIMLSIAKLHVQGYNVQLDLLFPATNFNAVALPKYPWQHDTYTAVTSLANKVFISPRNHHPLLGKQAKPPLPMEQISEDYKSWKSKYNRTDIPWLHHHKMGNVIVLPGAAFIEMMLSAASNILPSPFPVAINNVQFHKFHYSPDSEGSLYTTMNRPNRSLEEYQISVKTFDESEKSWVANATCSFETPNSKGECAQACLKIQEMKDAMNSKYSVDELYKKLSDGGVQIGPLFRTLTSAHFNEDMNEILVIAEISPALTNESDLYVIHPALFDACFQVVGIFTIVNKAFAGLQTRAIPKSVGSLHIQERIPPKIAIHAKQVNVGSDTSLEVKIANLESGKIIANVNNIQLQSIGSDVHSAWIWRREWVPVDTPSVDGNDESPTPTNSTCCCIIPDKLGVSESLINSLLSDGVYTPDLIREGDINNNEASVVDILPPNGVDLQHTIVLNSLNESARTVPMNEISREDFLLSQTDAALYLIRNVINVFSKNNTHNVAIWIVTKGAMEVSPTDTYVDPFLSKEMALSLVSAHETPDLFVATIDLPKEATFTQCIDMLGQFFKMPMMSENCLAIRGSAVSGGSENPKYETFALRVSSKPSSHLIHMTPCEAWSVDLQQVHRRDANPCVKPWQDSSKHPNPDSPEVNIKLEAFVRQQFKELEQPCNSQEGFYFVGVTVSQASIPTPKLDKNYFAGFCRTKLVTSTLLCKKSELVKLPQNVSPNEALAAMKKCLPLFAAFQRVKVSSRTATSSILLVTNTLEIHSEFAKRFARSTDMSITIVTETIENQETTYDGIRIVPKATADRSLASSSVDTLIICPSFELEEQYLNVLLGKLSVWGEIIIIGGTSVESEQLWSRQIHLNVSDVEVLLSRTHQSVARDLLKSLMKLMFVHEKCSTTFANFQDSITLDNVTPAKLEDNIVQSVSPIEVPFDFHDFNQRFRVEPLVSYLVVGGTKGIGFEVARWLVAHGANKIYISGRNIPSREVTEIIDRVHGRIEFMKCDVSDGDQTMKLLISIKDRTEFPLNGIFHCAAVFADQSLENVTDEMWNKVMLPKAYGALLLHQITLKLEIPLKYFVVFSSITEYLGNAGQAAYCTANAFLTSLCQFRRRCNLPAIAIAPGAISQVGYAAREGYDEVFDSRGVMSVGPVQVNDALAWSFMTDTTDFGLTGDFNRQVFGLSSPLVIIAKQTQHISVIKGLFTTNDIISLRNRENVFSSCSSPAEAHALIMKVLEEFLKARLGVTSAISDNVSLSSYGLDSGMAFELSSVIESNFKTTMSSIELLSDAFIISDIVSLVYQRGSSRKENTIVEVKRNLMVGGTQWLEQPRYIKTARADLFCFPSTGNGMSMFIDVADKLRQGGIRVWVAHMPGWEGRLDEKPSSDLEYLVNKLASCIYPLMKSRRVAFLGCGMGSFLSSQVMRALQNKDGVSFDQFYVIGWYPPSVPYSVVAERNPDNGDFAESKTGSKLFIDNRDIRQSHPDRNVILNVQTSTKICNEYKNVASAPLKTNVMVFSGKRDLLLSPKICSKWREEVHPDYTFEHVVVQTDHKLLRNKKTHRYIVSKIMSSLIQQGRQQPHWARVQTINKIHVPVPFNRDGSIQSPELRTSDQ